MQTTSFSYVAALLVGKRFPRWSLRLHLEPGWPSLGNYAGYLQADDYSGWAALFRGGKVRHVACHVHARRMFYKIYRQLRKESPQSAHESVAAQALAWIRKLYDIERKLRDAVPIERRRVR